MGLNHIMGRRTWRRIVTSAMDRGIPMLRTSTTMAIGLDTTGARMIRTTIWIIPMIMGISPVDLDRRMCGICTEADQSASFLAASILAWLPTIWVLSMAGTGMA